MITSAGPAAVGAPDPTYDQGVLQEIARCPGVTELGQSSGLDDAYRIHHIDTGSIVDAAMTMVGR